MKFFGILPLALMLGPLSAWAEDATISVQISNALPATGILEISLFDTEESFMKEPVRQVSAEIGEDGSAVALFIGLPGGNYAVVAAHDANDNGQLDRGFLGFGAEPFGFSNDVRPWFGWPSFADASFRVESGETEIQIHLD
jgi:uncharacterized protein (DUF2141 family)